MRALVTKILTKICMSALIITSVVGCANMATSYGNFTKNSADIDQRLADDAAKELFALYLPASTQFHLQQSSADTFGTALVDALRSNGYAVLEDHPKEKATGDTKGQVQAATAATGTTNRDLRYVVDHLDSNLYRVVISVGDQLLVRGYATDGTTVSPAGAWARKE